MWMLYRVSQLLTAETWAVAAFPQQRKSPDGIPQVKYEVGHFHPEVEMLTVFGRRGQNLGHRSRSF